jgi:methylated-DNA-[protein]-cysteine S-methyltransferase
MRTTTIDTPVGPFTIVGRGKAVLASGFTSNADELIALIPPDTLAAEPTGAEPTGAEPTGAEPTGAEPAGAVGQHGDDPADDGTDLEPAIAAVRAYFDGDLAAIDTIEVEQHGAGEFLDHAFDVLRTVPPGETVTYRDFATRAGRPAAIRAAASACARNAAALFVPCHRIVRTDGGLGGYRYGLEIKRWLRAHEQGASSADGETRS